MKFRSPQVSRTGTLNTFENSQCLLAATVYSIFEDLFCIFRGVINSTSSIILPILLQQTVHFLMFCCLRFFLN